MAAVSGYEGSITIPNLALDAVVTEWRFRQTKVSWDAFVKKQDWKEKQFGPKRAEITATFILPTGLTVSGLEILDSPGAVISCVCTWESTTHKVTMNMTMRDVEISNPSDGPCELTAQFKNTDAADPVFLLNPA